MEEKLSKRGEKFLQKLLETQDRVEAYKYAYKPKTQDPKKIANAARQRYHQITKSKAASELLELQGLGKQKVVEMIDELLNAEKDNVHQGKIISKSPDNVARYNTLNLLCDIHGLKQKQRAIETNIYSKRQTLIVQMDMSKLDEPDRPVKEIEEEFIREYERTQNITPTPYIQPVSETEEP